MAQVAQSVMKTVLAKYKTIKSLGHEIALIKFNNAEYDVLYNREYSFVKEELSLATNEGRLKMPYERNGTEQYFENNYSFGTAKIIYKNNKFMIHIPVTKDYPQTTPFEINKVVGIDLGINFLATCYDSYGKTLFFSGKEIKSKRGHYKLLRKNIQQNDTQSAKRKLNSIGSRENRWISDVNHSITKALVEHYGENTLFVLEDLTGIRNSTEKVKLKDRYVSVSWAFYQFRQFLEYKAKMNQSMVIALDPCYTSQTCPKCGHIEKANRNKKQHIFKCKNCSYTSNDDRIGAMNLYRKGLEYLESSCIEKA